jgi:hypothetical protein
VTDLELVVELMARLSRSDLHKIHEHLTTALGLRSPTPTSPLTASMASPHRSGKAP